MDTIITTIQTYAKEAVNAVFNEELTTDEILINATRKEFAGEYTVVTFPMAKKLRKKPADIVQLLGEWLVNNNLQIDAYNGVQGFLNLSFSNVFWASQLNGLHANPLFWKSPKRDKKMMVEFSSPNTNKPLHLGHIRNILLGWSCAKIYDAVGYEVQKVQIINDRGIAICKSMLAWQKYADGTTPEKAVKKSDHFVGDYYVLFEQKLMEEYIAWQKTEAGQNVWDKKGNKITDQAVFFKDYKNTYFNEHSHIGREAREMLLSWEADDAEVRALWRKMNQWVYDGFEATYKQLGVDFDKLYYESETYLLGKDFVDEGLKNNVFYKKPDGSVWVDLEDEGMDHKIVLRSDGTSVYITQDIGTAELRYRDFEADKMVYTVADEQNYHFKVLFEIMKKLGRPYADGLFHLSYGMVDLPSGKMKSREGTIVDADDLMATVIEEARKNAIEHGSFEGLPDEEVEEILYRIGLGALKFFIIKVDAKKRMTFDPQASVDMQGQTGPYIQNAFVRIQSILRKAAMAEKKEINKTYNITADEKKMMVEVLGFKNVVEQAAEKFEPSLVANYNYNLAKEFHRYYHEYRILTAESDEARAWRLSLIEIIGSTLKSGMDLIGIQMPKRM